MRNSILLVILFHLGTWKWRSIITNNTFWNTKVVEDFLKVCDNMLCSGIIHKLDNWKLGFGIDHQEPFMTKVICKVHVQALPHMLWFGPGMVNFFGTRSFLIAD